MSELASMPDDAPAPAQPAVAAAAAALPHAHGDLRRVALRHRPGSGPDAEQPFFWVGDQVEVARHLRKALAKERLLFDLGDIYRYRESGVWTPIPTSTLVACVADLSAVTIRGTGEKEQNRPLAVSNSFAKETVALLGTLVLEGKERRTFAEAPEGLVFTNGFLTMVKGIPTLLPHSPDHLARFAYPFAYARHVPHPELDAFLASCFRAESPADQQRLPMLLQEYLGACLFGKATSYEQVLLLTGLGGNGKSQFLHIARSVFPTSSLSAVPPQEWSEPYAVIGLAGKLANIVDEIPEREISSGAVLKKIVSGQATYGNQKYKPAITFEPRCGQIWCANHLPGSTDSSDGFFRRFAVVPFRSTPPPGEAVLEIGRLIVERELRALVSWAIEGYVRLVAQGTFTRAAAVAEQSEAWRTDCDNVRRFAFAAYDAYPSLDEGIAPLSLYKMYAGWLDATGGIGKLSFGKFVRRARETKLVVMRGRVFVWNQPEIERLLALMASSAPEWGPVPSPPAHTYRSPFQGLS